MPRKDGPGEGSAFDDIDAQIEAAGGEEPAGAEERLHPILSNEEVLEARAKARAKIEADRRAKAMKRVEQEETERLRREEGLTTGDRVKDEIVDITIDVAPYTDRLTVNGQPYFQGFTYPVARHVADSLREQMARSWQHQDEIDGKNKVQQFAANRQFKMLAKGKAAPTTGGVTVGAGGVTGVVPKNIGLRAGPEDHANG